MISRIIMNLRTLTPVEKYQQFAQVLTEKQDSQAHKLQLAHWNHSSWVSIHRLLQTQHRAFFFFVALFWSSRESARARLSCIQSGGGVVAQLITQLIIKTIRYKWKT